MSCKHTNLFGMWHCCPLIFLYDNTIKKRVADLSCIASFPTHSEGLIGLSLFMIAALFCLLDVEGSSVGASF